MELAAVSVYRNLERSGGEKVEEGDRRCCRRERRSKGDTAGQEGDRRSKEDEEDGEERRLDVVSINRRLQAAGWTPIRGPNRGSVSRSGTS